MGIFASVALMALALVLVRVEGVVVSETLTADDQLASVVAVTDSNTLNDQTSLRDAIAGSVDSSGNVQKLIIDDIRLGSGAAVAIGDIITVDYVGTLPNGQEFDNSYTRGEPFTFEVGAGRVIAGWEQGVVGMQVGGQRIIVIPPDQAYGNKVVGPIPANATLVFAIELVSIK